VLDEVEIPGPGTLMDEEAQDLVGDAPEEWGVDVDVYVDMVNS